MSWTPPAEDCTCESAKPHRRHAGPALKRSTGPVVPASSIRRSRVRLMAEYLRRSGPMGPGSGRHQRMAVLRHRRPRGSIDPSPRDQAKELETLIYHHIGWPSVDGLARAALRWAARSMLAFSSAWPEDPYEPILLMFDRGGAWTTEAGFIDLGASRSPVRRHLARPSLAPPSADGAALRRNTWRDHWDRTGAPRRSCSRRSGRAVTWADLTDAQWAVREPLLPRGKRRGCPPKWTKRQLIDGIRWRTRVGAPWRDVRRVMGTGTRSMGCYAAGSAMVRVLRSCSRCRPGPMRPG